MTNAIVLLAVVWQRQDIGQNMVAYSIPVRIGKYAYVYACAHLSSEEWQGKRFAMICIEFRENRNIVKTTINVQ